MSASPSAGLSPAAPIARGSLGRLPLRAALTRGALITAANWPVILVQLVATSACRAVMAVPIVGGVFMVAVLSEAEVGALFADGVRAAAGLVAASLLNRPRALGSFVAAMAVVVVGTGIISWLIQAGVMGTLAQGEWHVGPQVQARRRMELLTQAGVWSVQNFMASVSRFGRRFVLAGTWLYLGYATVLCAVIGALTLAAELAVRPGWSIVLPLAAVAATATAFVVVAILQLAHALLQAIMLTDDCRFSSAVSRLGPFLHHDARQVLGIFGVVLVLLALAAAASLLATAGLALVAWVPLVGLVVVPLQLAAWLARGVVFHFMDLSAWSAYQGQYRRYVEPEVCEPQSGPRNG